MNDNNPCATDCDLKDEKGDLGMSGGYPRDLDHPVCKSCNKRRKYHEKAKKRFLEGSRNASRVG